MTTDRITCKAMTAKIWVRFLIIIDCGTVHFLNVFILATLYHSIYRFSTHARVICILSHIDNKIYTDYCVYDSTFSVDIRIVFIYIRGKYVRRNPFIWLTPLSFRKVSARIACDFHACLESEGLHFDRLYTW